MTEKKVIISKILKLFENHNKIPKKVPKIKIKFQKSIKISWKSRKKRLIKGDIQFIIEQDHPGIKTKSMIRMMNLLKNLIMQKHYLLNYIFIL